MAGSLGPSRPTMLDFFFLQKYLTAKDSVTISDKKIALFPCENYFQNDDTFSQVDISCVWQTKYTCFIIHSNR